MNIIQKLSKQSIKVNKKRSVALVLSIAITTSLMLFVGIIFSTFYESSFKKAIEENWDYNIAFYNLSIEDIRKISNLENVVEVYCEEDIDKETIVQANNQELNISLKGADRNYFSRIKLLSGRLPEKSDEIIVPKDLLLYYDELSTLTIKDKEYKVVGFCESVPMQLSGYENVYTIMQNDPNNVYIVFDEPDESVKYTVKIRDMINITEDTELKFNDNLLIYYGLADIKWKPNGNSIRFFVGYDFRILMVLALALILGLTSVFSAIMIYNAFNITMVERKKYYGTLASIGITKKQLKNLVLDEAKRLRIYWNYRW